MNLVREALATVRLGAPQIHRNLALFPLAFSFLVLQKAYSVGRASIVPAVVHDDEELDHSEDLVG